MLVAVLSDIHANLTALRAALRVAEARGADALVCLGDVVGYGPRPAECIDVVRAEFDLCVMGNHDLAVATGEDLDVLPRDGRLAAEHHRATLDKGRLDWLALLPYAEVRHGATYVHAAPLHPEAWPRLSGHAQVREQFEAFDTAVCFVGHSHKPAIVADALGVFRVRPGHRYLVDVGSVGQPRDHNPQLSFGLFDTEAFAVELVREHYDVEQTAAAIERVGLPASLADRLREGV